MEKQEEKLFNFLHESGKIGRMRKRLIALLLCVEDIHADIKEKGEDDDEILNLAKKIDLILSEFVTSQKLADRMIAAMTPGERKAFIGEVPEILDIFGWHDKFNENGELSGESLA